MKALPYDDVSYCMYGFRYQKTTRIWNNLPWVPKQPVFRTRQSPSSSRRGRRVRARENSAQTGEAQMKSKCPGG